MKRFYSISLSLIFGATSFAQAPLAENVLDQLVAQNELALPKTVNATQLPSSTPQGEVSNYNMSAYFYYMSSFYLFTDQAVDMTADADGKTVYLSSLFDYKVPELVHTATWNGNKLVISADDVCYKYDYYGDGQYIYNMKVAEVIISGSSITGVKDMELVREADGTLHVDDDLDNPTRYYALYSNDDKFRVWTYGLAFNLEPFTPESEIVTIPETAKKQDYIYSLSDSYGSKSVLKGTVAVDGNDYYFNQLTKAGGIVKGTREGNKITVPEYQYIGKVGGSYLYATGYVTDWEVDENGTTIGEFTDLVFRISDDNRTITLLEPENTLAMNLYPDGSMHSFNFIDGIERYDGDGPAIPSDPYDLWIQDYHDSYGQYFLEFNIDALDKDGRYINPEKLAYRVFFDDDVYEFTIDNYEYIEENMTVLPYGFIDLHGGYDIYQEGNAVQIWFYEDLFNTIGVQQLYTIDGTTYHSNIVSVDLEGEVYVKEVADELTGVHSSTLRPAASCSWYDLSGRRIKADAKGYAIVNGKKVVNR